MTKLILDHVKITAPIIINGRGASLKNSFSISDDGVWDINGTVSFLKLISDLSPEKQIPISLYLPHTAFLFGKIIKIAKRIQEYSYIEEGSAATEYTELTMSNRDVDAAYLLQRLTDANLIDSLGIDRNAVLAINESTNHFYDPFNHKYKGSFSILESAFKGGPNVTRFELGLNKEREIYFPNSWLCILPAVLDMAFLPEDERISQYSWLMNGLSLTSEVARLNECNIVIKRHPVDISMADSYEALRSISYGISQFGVFFEDLEFPVGVDKNLELAFLGFNKYIQFGQSSASLYLKQFCKEDDFREIVQIR